MYMEKPCLESFASFFDFFLFNFSSASSGTKLSDDFLPLIIAFILFLLDLAMLFLNF